MTSAPVGVALGGDSESATDFLGSPAWRWLLLILLLAACDESRSPSLSNTGTGDASGDEWRGTVDTTASGAVHVVNLSGRGWDAREAETLSVHHRVTGLDTAGTEPFGAIDAVTVDELGRLYVADRLAHQIHVFRDDGTHLRSLGREGQGPGEFSRPFGFAWQDDETLWIADIGRHRYVLYDTAGSHLRELPRPPFGMRFPWEGIFDSGRILELSRGSQEALLAFSVEPRLELQDSFPIPRSPVPPGDEYPGFWVRRGPAILFAAVPYAPRWLWVFNCSGGLWAGYGGEYRIVRLTLEGDTALVITRPREERPEVNSEERTRAVAGLRESPDADLSRIPDEKPFFRELVPAPDGGLWVLREGEGDRWFWDVFDGEGRFQGAVEMPVVPTDGGIVAGELSRTVLTPRELIVVTPGAHDIPVVVRMTRD